MIDATVCVIRGDPLIKIVNSTVVRVMSLDHFELSLSGPIDRQVKKLTEIVAAQC